MPRNFVPLVPHMQPKMQHSTHARSLVPYSKPRPPFSYPNLPSTLRYELSNCVTSILRCLALGFACDAPFFRGPRSHRLLQTQQISLVVYYILRLDPHFCSHFLRCLEKFLLKVEFALLGRCKLGVGSTALWAIGLNCSSLLIGCSDGLGLGSEVTLGGTARDASLAATKEGGIFGGDCFGGGVKLGDNLASNLFKIAFLGYLGLHFGSGGTY